VQAKQLEDILLLSLICIRIDLYRYTLTADVPMATP
jgi:hypothetical protein